MNRKSLLAGLVFALAAVPAGSQEWTKELLEVAICKTNPLIQPQTVTKDPAATCFFVFPVCSVLEYENGIKGKYGPQALYVNLANLNGISAVTLSSFGTTIYSAPFITVDSPKDTVLVFKNGSQMTIGPPRADIPPSFQIAGVRQLFSTGALWSRLGNDFEITVTDRLGNVTKHTFSTKEIGARCPPIE